MEYIIFASLIIDLLGFTVILPLFPSLIEYYSKNDSTGLFSFLNGPIVQIQQTFNIPVKYLPVFFGGLLSSLFSLLQFIASPLTGALSDVYGRKPILLLTLVGISISYLLWSISKSFPLFVLARIVGGASKGNVSLAYCIMSDVLEPAKRSKGMALIGVAFSIGFIIGPIVGVLFATWGSTGWFALSALYAFVLSVINVIFTYFMYKETLPQKDRRSSVKGCLQNAFDYVNPASLLSFRTIKDLKQNERKLLQKLGLINFIYMFIFSGLEFTITFLTHHNHGFTSVSQGKMFTYLGVLMTIVQGGFVRRLKQEKEKFYCLLGFLIMVPSFIIIGNSTSVFSLYTGLTLYVIGSSLVQPLLATFASRFGQIYEKGAIFGIFRSLGSLARTVGPLTAAICFWVFGSAWTYSVGGLALFIPFYMLKSF